MLINWQSIVDLLVDPVDGSRLVPDHADRARPVLRSARQEFEFVDGQPVLLTDVPFDSGGWRFAPISLREDDRPKPARPVGSLAKRMRRRLRTGAGGTGARARFVELLRDDVELGRRALIVGGASVGEGSEPLVFAPDIEVISFDVYPTACTTFVADGHRIPLADDSVDAVWIQAVLEHVYRPEEVVDQIVRVLRPGGLLYAETPFLQPVHEGAYDYVRFTHSGHRLLFARFDEIESGPIGGPGALFSLAVRGLVGGLTRRRLAARLAYGVTQPAVLLDRFVPLSWRVDFAVGSTFIGRLCEAAPRRFDADATYRGSQRGDGAALVDSAAPTSAPQGS